MDALAGDARRNQAVQKDPEAEKDLAVEERAFSKELADLSY